ncbi:TonB-dependent siderophore receptor [Aquabacterium sp.]|uniref:TonB-dependent siderophore receptor n=1 Tax=Aquabacterium sp. TaxID=1872578 RepID=UPI002BE90CC9|nr:TonB-dependent receptor [Aquabacterium sp.]HSW08779.1 TonB-dependent receptor [Aquabacterium sp.]
MTRHPSTLPAHRAARRPLAARPLCALAIACAAHAASFAAPPAAGPMNLQQAAQPLDQALVQLAARMGLLIGVDAELVRGKQAPALNGSYTPQAALRVLLEGSGLEAVAGTDGSYSLKRAAPAAAAPAGTPPTRAAAAPGTEAVLPVVRVKASAASPEYTPSPLTATIGGGALGARTQLETPLSTTVVTSDELAQRQVSKLGDVFALDAAVTDNSGAYSSWASYVSVRGLELDWQNAYRIDGNPFLSYAITLPYEHFEQIELLKGSSGFLHGFGSPGGLINYVTKKPSDEPLRTVEIGHKSNSIWTAGIDLGGRLGTGKTFGYRLSAVHEDGKTFNDGTVDRQSVSLALDTRLTPELTWHLESLYQQRRTEGQTPAISAQQLADSHLPGTVRGDNQGLLSQGQFLDTEFGIVSTGLSYRLGPNWVASTRYSHSSSRRSRNESILYLQNAAGDYDEFRSDTREGHGFDHWQALVEGRMSGGGIEHQLTAGASWQQQSNDYSVNGVWTSLGSGSLFRPNGSSYLTQGGLNLYRAGDITQKAAFASDTLKLSERWSVLAGLRHTRYAQTDFDTGGSPQGRYADRVTTPTVALMFKPAPGTLLYGSTMESLEPGRTVGSTYANANRLLDPLVSRQYEVGAKSEQRDWQATAALFRIERPSEYANAANVLVQEGESVYQGLELAAAGRLGSQWQLAGSLMRLDARYARGLANIGHRVAGAPEWMATARVVYQVPQLAGLDLTADAKFTGDVMLNAANTVVVGRHTVVNLGAVYRLRIGGYAATLRAAVNNAGQARFWEYQYANWIKPADPRSISLSGRLEF